MTSRRVLWLALTAVGPFRRLAGGPDAGCRVPGARVALPVMLASLLHRALP